MSNKTRIEEAKETFLMAKYCTQGNIKLVPIENDKAAYERIFSNDKENFVPNSKMTSNYQFFYEQFEKETLFASFDDLRDAIERLQIISIELGKNDDAQLIFESLNSTGLALTEADQIRNYMLMSLSAKEQEQYFKDYWQKIEIATDYNPTMFLRDYLTIMQQSPRHVKQQNLYSEWKKYMSDKDRGTELSQMYDYAKYYKQIITCNLATPMLSSKLRHFSNLETDICNVFFIQFLKYATTKQLSEDEIYKVIDLVENYFARRIVCGIPSNALTQVFCVLHKDVLRSIEESQSTDAGGINKYSDILAFHLLRREGNSRFPNDDQFKESICSHDAYHLPKSYKIFIFERLENWKHGEYVDVAEDFRNKDVTIEHIMPQKLNSKWKDMLGNDYERIQEKYLHTFANLTLTGINSELSNNPFEIKRDGKKIDGSYYPGYKDSKYRLTRDVTQCEKWTETELEQRCKNIVRIFLQLYPMPKTNFKPKPKLYEEVSLDNENFSPTNKTLKGFRLFGEKHNETKWVEMQVRVCEEVLKRYPDKVDYLFSTGKYFFTEKNADLRCTQIASTEKYLLTSIDNKSKLKCLRLMFEVCDIPESELVMILDLPKENGM